MAINMPRFDPVDDFSTLDPRFVSEKVPGCRCNQPTPDPSSREAGDGSAEDRDPDRFAGPPGPSRVGRQVDRYRILGGLGQGGMGTVYLALDPLLDRHVALKVCLAPEEDEPHALERFRREARAAAALHHPGLCPIYDLGQADGDFYLVMPVIDGESLAALIARESPLPQRRAAELVSRLARALSYAHARGVVHRDLKPTNIMLAADGTPVVIDYGLALILAPGVPRLTRAGMVLGTPYYMAPEQVEGDVGAMGPACDVYGLGVILYGLLTGRRPFEGSVGSVLGKILFSDPPPPAAHRPDLDPILEAICRRAMARAIGGRHPSMESLAADLAAYLGEVEACRD